MSRAIGPGDLPAFVQEVDRLGGPGAPGVEAYWREIVYAPATPVDREADPFGASYMAAQLALYREISGRPLDQVQNEHTAFNLGAHVEARNPYNHGDPGMLANQLVQLATAFKLARPRRGARVLDMGCGWGLSSELASYLGLDVHAVDINPDFVTLVRTRAERYRYPIRASCSSFDAFTTDERLDLILFYECLHHAVEPWTLLERLATMLSPGGQIVACGEPINRHWWPAWGLRLDPMSLYCIHKHGWFESGWSEDFIVRCLDRALLNSQVVTDPDPSVGQFLLASKDPKLSVQWISRNCTVEGATLDGDYIVASQNARITLKTPLRSGRKALVIANFRPRPVKVKWRRGAGPVGQLALPPGETRLPVDDWNVGEAVQFESETWIPAYEIGNLDTRRLAFQIAGVELADSCA